MKLSRKTIAITIIATFTLVNSTVSLSHHHQFDFKLHDKCLACIHSTTMVSSLEFSRTNYHFDLPLKSISLYLFVKPLKSSDFKFFLNNKSPPLQ